MLFVLYTILPILPLLCHALTPVKFAKPSFAPYCSIKDKCRAVCSCQITPNCSLLPMDDAIRESIIFYHNQIRQIQTYAEPVPSGMTMLQYDMQLEELSKCWALRCDNEYSACFMTPRFAETSQSVVQLLVDGKTTPSTFFWVQILNFWLGETKSMSAETINVLPGGEKGEKLHNYAQLLSDSVQFVGCSWSTSNSTLTFVCTYGPRGPVWGEPIYKRGETCSSCPERYGCDNLKPFQNLCKEGIKLATSTPLQTPPSPPPLAPTTMPSIPLTLPPVVTPHVTSTSASFTTPPQPPPPPPPPPTKTCQGSSTCMESPGLGKQEEPELSREHFSGIKEHFSSVIAPDQTSFKPYTGAAEYQGNSNSNSFSAHLVESTSRKFPGKEVLPNLRFDYDQDQDHFMSEERRISKPYNDIKSIQGFTPLVPLRNVPHSSLLSSSVISKPIKLPPPHPAIFSRIRNNASVSTSKGQSQMLAPAHVESSQFVPAYHATYGSAPYQQGQYISPRQTGLTSNPRETYELRGEGSQMAYEPALEQIQSDMDQPSPVHSDQPIRPYNYPNDQNGNLESTNPNSQQSIPRFQEFPPESGHILKQPLLSPKLDQIQKSPIPLPQSNQNIRFNPRYSSLSMFYPTPGALLPSRQPPSSSLQGQLIPQPSASIIPDPISPTAKIPSGRRFRRRHRRNSYEQVYFSRILIFASVSSQIFKF